MVGGVVMAIDVDTPAMDEDRSINVTVSKDTFAVRALTVGAGGVATTMETVTGADVPPGPVAVKAKLSGPK